MVVCYVNIYSERNLYVNHFSARINDGTSFPTHQGAVEVFVGDKWSTVCDTGFDDKAASESYIMIVKMLIIPGIKFTQIKVKFIHTSFSHGSNLFGKFAKI